MDTTLLAFAGVSLLLAVTPGPDMAVVTKNALAHGRRGVVLTTSGIGLALVVWVTATAVGLSALLRTSGEVLFALKLGVFFVTFLPQFVLPGQAVLPRLLELGVTFAVIGWIWMNAYGLFVTRLREVITAPRVRQWMQRVTGVVLLGFGARLAIERV